MASIPVSDELRRTFETVDPAQIRAILVQNQANTLELVKALPSTSSQVSDKQDFFTLLGAILSNEPNRSGYVLYRLDSQAASGDWEWICCAYQPEGAKIKEKMQYALTRSSLMSGLGERNILETIFGSTPTDFIWPTKLRNQRKHDYQNPQLRTEGKPASEAAGTGVGGAKRFFGSRSAVAAAAPPPSQAAPAPAPAPASAPAPAPAPVKEVETIKAEEAKPVETPAVVDGTPAPASSGSITPPPPAILRRDSNELTSAFKSPVPPEDDEQDARPENLPNVEEEKQPEACTSNGVTPSNGSSPTNNVAAVAAAAATEEDEQKKESKTPVRVEAAPVVQPQAKSSVSIGYGQGASKTGMTEQEEESAKLRKLQSAERSSTLTTGGPKLGFKWQDGVEEAIQGLASTASGTSEWNLVVISIDLKNEVLELESPPRFVPPADLPASLSEKEPRIAFYRLDDTSIKAAGSATDSGESVVAMLYCCPASSSVKARMLYSSNVLSVLNYVNTFSGMRVVKKIESSDRNELTHGNVTDEIEAVLARERQKFAGTGIDAVVSGSAGVATGFARPRKAGAPARR